MKIHVNDGSQITGPVNKFGIFILQFLKKAIHINFKFQVFKTFQKIAIKMFKHKKLQANAHEIKRLEDLIYFCARKKVKTKLLNSLLVQNEKNF